MDIIMNERESRNVKKLTKLQLWTAEIQIEIHHLSDTSILESYKANDEVIPF